MGAGVDAGFEAADGAGDEFGAAPEDGDDALLSMLAIVDLDIV